MNRIDRSGLLFHWIKVSKMIIWRVVDTFIVYLLAKLKGVRLGETNRFIGLTYFERVPGSEIIIGNCNEFRSHVTSNPLGINHKCMITTLQSGAKILIGNNCGLSGVSISSALNVTIGDNVRVGANSLVIDTDGHLDDYRVSSPRKIVIGNNVWLGMNVVVLKGVEIGDNTLIGANSVVTKSVPANVIAAGNPCKVIKYLDK